MNEIKLVAVVPCSGIGKTYGSVSREAAYELVEKLRPNNTQIVPLALLVLGDEASRNTVGNNPAITIDGCKLACAAKMVQENAGRIVKEFAVLEVYRRHKEFKPKGIAQLNEEGRQLANALANEAAFIVDECIRGEKNG